MAQQENKIPNIQPISHEDHDPQGRNWVLIGLLLLMFATGLFVILTAIIGGGITEG